MTMKFSELVSADICQAAIEQSPAHRATLYHRRRRVAEKRLHECSNLSWGTSETLSCMYASDHAVMCMGGFLLFFFFHYLLRKWRRHKGAYPTASHYASHASVNYNKVASKVHKIWRRQKRALDRTVFHLKIWCLVLYYLILGKLYRARTRFKKKIAPLVHRMKSVYMKVTFSIYRHLPPSRTSAMVIFLGLFMSGDVELNPGPKKGMPVAHSFIVDHYQSTMYSHYCHTISLCGRIMHVATVFLLKIRHKNNNYARALPNFWRQILNI